MALYHTAKGSNNYAVVGSPTVVNGVVSGFSGSNYLNIGNGPDFNQDTEIVTRLKLNQNYSAGAYIISWSTGYSCGLQIGSSKKASCFFSKTSSDNSTILSVNGNYVFNEDTFYFIKVKKTGYTLELYYSTDGNNWTLDNSASNSNMGTISSVVRTRIGVNSQYTPGGAFNGSIDLNNTYIKVNGQPWFGVCPIEVKKHQIMGPVGYTVVGSPTISNGVVSGFSGSNYLETQSIIDSNTTQEWNVAFTVGADRWDDQDIMTSPHNLRILLRSAKITVAIGDSESYASTEEVTVNTSYIVNVQTTNNSVVIKYKEANSSSFIEIYNGTSVIGFSNQSPCRFGVYSSAYPHQFKGTIDLNKTYIKVNGKLWFWQPQETKKIVVNGVQVWEKTQ